MEPKKPLAAPRLFKLLSGASLLIGLSYTGLGVIALVNGWGRLAVLLGLAPGLPILLGSLGMLTNKPKSRETVSAGLVLAAFNTGLVLAFGFLVGKPGGHFGTSTNWAAAVLLAVLLFVLFRLRSVEVSRYLWEVHMGEEKEPIGAAHGADDVVLDLGAEDATRREEKAEASSYTSQNT